MYFKWNEFWMKWIEDLYFKWNRCNTNKWIVGDVSADPANGKILLN